MNHLRSNHKNSREGDNNNNTNSHVNKSQKTFLQNLLLHPYSMLNPQRIIIGIAPLVQSSLLDVEEEENVVDPLMIENDGVDHEIEIIQQRDEIEGDHHLVIELPEGEIVEKMKTDIQREKVLLMKIVRVRVRPMMMIIMRKIAVVEKEMMITKNAPREDEMMRIGVPREMRAMIDLLEIMTVIRNGEMMMIMMIEEENVDGEQPIEIGDEMVMMIMIVIDVENGMKNEDGTTFDVIIEKNQTQHHQ